MEKGKRQLRSDGKQLLRARGLVSQIGPRTRPSNHAGPFMVTASIAETHLGLGGYQCSSPLAQDLRLIRTRPEKSVR